MRLALHGERVGEGPQVTTGNLVTGGNLADQEQPKLLSFDEGLQASYGSASDKLHAIVRRVIKQAEMKQGDDFAASLGLSGPHLSEALSGRGVKHFSLRWLPRVIHVDKDRELLTYAAGLVRCKLIEKEPLSWQQKFERLKAELRDGGADVDALEERAFRRGE